MKTINYLEEKIIEFDCIALTLTQLKDLVNLLENNKEESKTLMYKVNEPIEYLEELKIEKIHAKPNRMTVDYILRESNPLIKLSPRA